MSLWMIWPALWLSIGLTTTFFVLISQNPFIKKYDKDDYATDILPLTKYECKILLLWDETLFEFSPVFVLIALGLIVCWPINLLILFVSSRK